MHTPSDDIPVLSYGRPEGGVRRWVRWVPRPSPWTLILVLLAGLSQWWIWTDHEPWVARHTFGQVAAISDDGRLLVTARDVSSGARGPFQIHDTRTGAHIATFGEADAWAFHVAFSPDNARVITLQTKFQEETEHRPGGSTVRRIYDASTRASQLWDAATGAHVAEIAPPIGRFGDQVSIRFSPDGTRILAIESHRALLFDARTGSRIGVLEQHDGSEGRVMLTGEVAISQDGLAVLQSASYQPIRIYSLVDGSLKAEHAPAHRPTNRFRATFSPDAQRLALGDFASVSLIDPQTGQLVVPSTPLGGLIESLAFSRDGRQLIVLHSAMASDAITAIDVATGSVTATAKLTHRHLRSVAVTPDGQQIVVARFGKLEVFDLPQLTARFVSDPAFRYETLAFSPDGSLAATIVAVSPADVRLVSPKSWNETSRIDGRRQTLGIFNRAQFVGDARHLLTRADGGQARLWVLRRPESKLGVAALPQFWLAVITSTALVMSAGHDIQRHRQRY